MRNAPITVTAVVSLVFLTAAPAPIPTALADPVLPKPDTIGIKVEHVTVGKALLARDFQEQLRQEGLATDESPSRFYVALSPGIAAGKASISESYYLTLPAGAPITLQPTGSRSQVGLELKVGSPEPDGRLRAEVGLSYRGRTVRRTVVVPSGSLVAFRLSTEEGTQSTRELAVLTLTRLPRPAK